MKFHVLLVFLLSQFVQFSYSDSGRIVCYYPNWGVYRDGPGKFFPKDIDPYLCTHLIYSFGKVLVDEATIAAGDPFQDIEKHGFDDFRDLKKVHNHDLKTLFAIGGYLEGSKQFTPIAKAPSSRTAFARNTLAFLKKYDFDGLNIDWQFPNDQDRDGSPEDYNNFVLLAQEIRRVYEEDAKKNGKARLLLTISVPGIVDRVEAGYNLIELEKYVDFMNVLAYNYHFAFEQSVNHHSPLYPLPEEIEDVDHENAGLNADATINYILSKGVKPATLNLGIPLYGRTFTLENENENTIGSPATGQGKAGPATREDGYIAYYEVCNNIKDNWKVVRKNETALGPYAYKGNQWVGYDDALSVRKKGEYSKRKGLGGLSFWSIDQDDFKASCGSVAYPLIKAGRQGYMRAREQAKKILKQIPTPVSRPMVPSLVQPSFPVYPAEDRNTLNGQVIDTINAYIEPLSRQRPPVQSADLPADNTPGEDQDPTPAHPVPVPAPPGPQGLMHTIYVWITTANIFHNASPSTIESALNANKQQPSRRRTTASSARPTVRRNPVADSAGSAQGLGVRILLNED